VAQLAGDFDTAATYVASGLPKFSRLQEAGYVTDPGIAVDLAGLPDLSHANIRTESKAACKLWPSAGSKCCSSRRLTRNSDSGLLQHPPGAHFRERSRSTSVLMFAAKHAAETLAPAEAITTLETIDAAVPGKYFVQFYLGLIHLKADRPESALPFFRRALELDPNPLETPSIYSYMGVALKDSGRFKEALRVLRKGLEIDPERTDIHNLMGFCHFKRGEHEKRCAAFQRAIELDPTSAIDYANLGVNYQALGDESKARHYYRMALKMDHASSSPARACPSWNDNGARS